MGSDNKKNIICKSNLTNKAIVMFIILAASKVLGFLRDVLLAYKFGTSGIVDAYTVAITVPNVLFAVFISGFNQSYLPYYTRIQTPERKQQFFSNMLVIYILISTSVTVIGFFLKEYFSFCLAPGFDTVRSQLCSNYIGIIIWSFPFYMLFAILSVQLQTHEDFAIANVCNFVVVNIVVIVSILLASPEHSAILPAGYSFAMIISCSILSLYFINTVKIKFEPKRDKMLDEFRELMIIAIPVGVSFMINQLNSVTDAIFASMFGNGVTSGLNYANRLQGIFLTMTTTVFMTVVYPRINDFFSKEQYRDGIYYISKGLQISSLLSIPFAVFLAFFSRDIIVVMFQRGAFDETSTIITSSCLMLYALGIPFYSYVEIGSRALTASLKQNIILKDTTIAVIFNICADFILIKTVGYVGLAMATSISGVLLTLLFFYDLKIFGIKCLDKTLTYEILKIILVSLFAIFLTFIFRNNVIGNIANLYQTLLTMLVFGMLYLVFCCAFKITAFSWLLNRVWSFRK